MLTASMVSLVVFLAASTYRVLVAEPLLGDVVRSGPNMLSFASVPAYKDIYGHVKHGEKRFLKNQWYDPKYDTAHQEPRIVRVRDPVVHGQQRKALSHAFSARALRDQEEVVHYYVNLLVQQFKNLGKDGQEPVNASLAWNWLTFDVIGKTNPRPCTTPPLNLIVIRGLGIRRAIRCRGRRIK